MSANYMKVEKVLEGGDILPFKNHPLLLKFAGGRGQHSMEVVLEDSQACSQFLLHDSPAIKELRFESWKWDWMHEPNDPRFGFLVKRLVCKA